MAPYFVIANVVLIACHLGLCATTVIFANLGWKIFFPICMLLGVIPNVIALRPSWREKRMCSFVFGLASWFHLSNFLAAILCTWAITKNGWRLKTPTVVPLFLLMGALMSAMTYWHTTVICEGFDRAFYNSNQNYSRCHNIWKYFSAPMAGLVYAMAVFCVGAELVPVSGYLQGAVGLCTSILMVCLYSRRIRIATPFHVLSGLWVAALLTDVVIAAVPYARKGFEEAIQLTQDISFLVCLAYLAFFVLSFGLTFGLGGDNASPSPAGALSMNYSSDNSYYIEARSYGVRQNDADVAAQNDGDKDAKKSKARELHRADTAVPDRSARKQWS